MGLSVGRYRSCTVTTLDRKAVRQGHELSDETYSTSQGWFNCCVKTLRTVLYSSHDNVPLKWKNLNGRPTLQFKIVYRLVPLYTHISFLDRAYPFKNDVSVSVSFSIFT